MVLEAPSPARGVLVPPGDYQVQVKAGGHTFAQPFTVLPDPRGTLAPAGYLAQYALSIRLRDAVSAANAAVLRIRAEKSRLGAADGSELG